MLDNYKGPFEVVKKLPHDRYLLQELPGSNRSLRAPYKNVEAVDKLKRWMPDEEIFSSSSDDDFDLNQLGIII